MIPLATHPWPTTSNSPLDRSYSNFPLTAHTPLVVYSRSGIRAKVYVFGDAEGMEICPYSFLQLHSFSVFPFFVPGFRLSYISYLYVNWSLQFPALQVFVPASPNHIYCYINICIVYNIMSVIIIIFTVCKVFDGKDSAI